MQQRLRRSKMLASAQDMMRRGIPVGLQVDSLTGEETIVALEQREAPGTLVGGVLLPLLSALLLLACCLRQVQPDLYARGETGVLSHWKPIEARLTVWIRRCGITTPAVTRVAVSLYFVHEGAQVFQAKWAQWEQVQVPLMTPFGPIHMMPTWQKGDAQDMVLLVTALCTATNVLPEIGLILLLVDVASDCLDLFAHLALNYLASGQWSVNEMFAKKISLLGVMVLVAIQKWKRSRAIAAAAASGGALPTDAELQVPY